MSRKINFGAGPATLPLPVLEQIKDEFVDYKGQGLSIVEMSHRSKTYDGIHHEAMALVSELLGLPDNYKVLFLQGGATLQFAMIPMNLLQGKRSCDFTITGRWASKAYDDAVKFGKVNVLYDGKENGYTELPDPKSLKVSPDAEYLHITSNETIGGIQWQDWPDTGDVPIVADMSSDIMSRRIPVEKFGLIYAGAQKNLGPAGATLVIVREDLLERCDDSLPAYLNLKLQAKKDSLYNTPPVFSVYAIKLVLEWMKNEGGVEEFERRAEQRSSAIYGVIDAYPEFYRSPVAKKNRSKMNVVFRLPTEELEKKFLAEAEAEGMIGMKGHRSVGGCRASIYNSMPVEGALKLAEFMKDFAEKNG